MSQSCGRRHIRCEGRNHPYTDADDSHATDSGEVVPNTFDICGASHQILDFMVVAAALAHTAGLFRAFKYARAEKA